ncbi:hypothetical protein PPL_08959 [Heterostelium album PN500]|uniref:RING-type domain-containing protein n=1 Tax=Heterostelium pallidum (strain ATCC 26659 / Pp 5 / PN500) TaxID=670386 RepID=D3BK78_HETP5|nr:hypothetical protein PPL_08959 [Heterostelium album PN500]EFA78308.1 hypothetical protein PPL_08959 [Heterostelium album PN500]|eukprot:XP_020430433.1 hypothetical protein PPL_08959 [Heterostelium album PN500]
MSDQNVHNIVNGIRFIGEDDHEELDIERIKFIMKHTPTPPISEYQFQELTEEVIITKRNKERIGDCTICVNEFPLDTEAIKLPCKHYYHFDCITQWLKMHSNCPNCRTQLPTNNSEYDAYSRILAEHEKKEREGINEDEDRSMRRQTKNSGMFS